MGFISHHITLLVIYSLGGRQTDRQTDRQKDRQTDIHTHTDDLHRINFKVAA